MPQLLDRDRECDAIDGLLKNARDGKSGTLVFWGEPGIGKSSLLEYAVAAAHGMLVVSLVGIASEMNLPFAALHQLLTSIRGGISRLPAPQGDALGAAFGLRPGSSPDSFLVALAALSLIARAAEKEPFVCVVDNADLLDAGSAQALSFVARRVDAEGVAFVLSVADPEHSPFTDLPAMEVTGLADDRAYELLAETVVTPLSQRVAARLVSEAAGNPLLLRELPEELTPDQLAGDAALPEALSLDDRLEDSFLRRVQVLPAETQSLLLLVAAEPSGDPDLIWRAAKLQDLPRKALAPAQLAGLLRVGAQLAFRHAFLRTAVYGAAAEGDRRRAHAALADATDATVDPDRAAWHRAAATPGPDEEAAEALARSAEAARRRGGYAAAATFLERAAELTPDPGKRAVRTLASAEAALAAGAPARAAALLDQATPGLGGEQPRAEALRLGGRLALALGENGHTSAMLLEAAQAFEPLDVRVARETYLEALEAGLYAGRLGRKGQLADVARAAQAAPQATEASGADFLLDGLAALVADGNASAAPSLRRAIDALRPSDSLRWVGLAGNAASELWDDEAMGALVMRRVELANAAGALTSLANGLSQLGGYELLLGDFENAQSHFDEARELADLTGNASLRGNADTGELLLAAWRGDEDRARLLAAACNQDAAARGIGIVASLVQHALAVLEIGLGRHEAALAPAREAVDDGAFSVTTRALPDLVEAAARARQPQLAATAAEQLADSALAGGTEWGLGVLAQSRALAETNEGVEELYLEAIDHLKRCRAIPYVGRARLLYGEWLRRKKRRRDARGQLQLAYELFAVIGADGFCDRAQRELAATGARIFGRKPAEPNRLTPHELRIARFVSEGDSNAEIAARLFVSPRTIEYHLHKIYRKLDIRTRTDLARKMLERRD